MEPVDEARLPPRGACHQLLMSFQNELKDRCTPVVVVLQAAGRMTLEAEHGWPRSVVPSEPLWLVPTCQVPTGRAGGGRLGVGAHSCHLPDPCPWKRCPCLQDSGPW